MSQLVVKMTARIACSAMLELKMDPRELKQWLSSVIRLTAQQKAELLKVLGAGVDEVQVRALVESRLDVCPACPHCAATHIVRYGNASGLQQVPRLPTQLQCPDHHAAGSTASESQVVQAARRAVSGPERASER